MSAQAPAVTGLFPEPIDDDVVVTLREARERAVAGLEAARAALDGHHERGEPAPEEALVAFFEAKRAFGRLPRGRHLRAV